jgi:phosphoglucomutase
MANMKALMDGLRSDPPVQIAGQAVAIRKDYADGSVLDLRLGQSSTMELSGSNVLRYEMTDNTTVLVRPSGTEPKVKVYILAQGSDQADCDAKIEKYAAWAQSLKK